MPTITMLLIVWGAITAVLVVLLIYRSTLTIHEDDQLFIDESESHMALEQAELITKIDKLTPLVRMFGAASGVLAVVIFGLWLYQGFMQNY